MGAEAPVDMVVVVVDIVLVSSLRSGRRLYMLAVIAAPAPALAAAIMANVVLDILNEISRLPLGATLAEVVLYEEMEAGSFGMFVAADENDWAVRRVVYEYSNGHAVVDRRLVVLRWCAHLLVGMSQMRVICIWDSRRNF